MSACMWCAIGLAGAFLTNQAVDFVSEVLPLFDTGCVSGVVAVA